MSLQKQTQTAPSEVGASVRRMVRDIEEGRSSSAEDLTRVLCWLLGQREGAAMTKPGSRTSGQRGLLGLDAEERTSGSPSKRTIMPTRPSSDEVGQATRQARTLGLSLTDQWYRSGRSTYVLVEIS